MAVKKPDFLNGNAQARAVQRASVAGKTKVQTARSSGGNLDQVVDSITGQVISVGKPAAIGGTVKGAGKSTASSMVNLGGSLIEVWVI